MRKLLALILLALPAFGTTTVSGNAKNLGTGAVGVGNFVRFWLRGCGQNTPRITGSGVIVPSLNGEFYFDVQSNSSGVLSGTIYSTRDATGNSGGDIECGGSTTAVWYGMQVFNGSYKGPEIPIHAKNGATLDPSNVTPITIPPVVTAPTGDNTYFRLDGGNSPITGGFTSQGNNTFTGSNTFSGPLSLTGTDSGNQTISGNKNSTGTSTFANINQTVYADQCAGADAGAKTATCIGLLPSTGGVVNATAFQGAQSFTPVTVTKNGVRILLGAATFTCSGRCFAVNANNFELAGQGDATDFVMANGTNANSIDIATDGAAHSGIYIHDVQLDGNAANQTLATYGIAANTAGGSVTNFRFENNFLHDHKRASNAGNEILVNVSGSSRGIIQLNRCLNHACVVVFGSDMTVSNNVATNTDDDAFAAVGGAGLPVSRITFVGNTVNGTTHGAGIDVVNGRNVTISANTIISANGNGIIAWDNGLGFANSTQDSTISGNSVISSGSNGINVIGTRDTITGNTVKLSGNNGIYVPTPATIINITGNMVMDNGLLAATNQSNGITIDGATNVLVSSNTASDDQGAHTQVSGIQAQSSPSAVYLLNNVMANNTTNGYAFLSGTSNLASGNIVNGVRQVDDRIQNTPTFASTGPQFPGMITAQSVSCTNGELALSAGWQSTGTATVSGAAGTGQTCSWQITTGTTTAANPTITDTLTNPLPSANTVCWMNIYGGTHTAVAGESLRHTTFSATAPIFTANFTPTAGGLTYFVTRSCGP